MSTVRIPWNDNADTIPKWNILCANIIEQFGLPGNRYTTSTTELEMLFEFKNKKDAFLCEILLSEHLTKPK